MQGAVEALSAYSYPGNVRELENILERALIFFDGGEILAADLGLASTRPKPPAATGPADAPSSLDAMERLAIERALSDCGGNRTRAAAALGISRRTILYRIKRYGLG